MAETAARVFPVLERCHSCYTALPVPPAPRICPKCNVVKITPHHTAWPRTLKTFLLIQFAKRLLFMPHRSIQESWELLLIGHYQVKQSNGRIIKHGPQPDEVFPQAMKEAEEWKLAGAQTEFL